MESALSVRRKTFKYLTNACEKRYLSSMKSTVPRQLLGGGADIRDPHCESERLRNRLNMGQEELSKLAHQLGMCVNACGKSSKRLRLVSTSMGLISPIAIGIQRLDILSASMNTVFGLAVASAAATLGTIQSVYKIDRRVGGARTLQALAIGKLRHVEDEWETVSSMEGAARSRAIRALRHAQATCISQIQQQAGDLEIELQISSHPRDLDWSCVAEDVPSQSPEFPATADSG